MFDFRKSYGPKPIQETGTLRRGMMNRPFLTLQCGVLSGALTLILLPIATTAALELTDLGDQQMDQQINELILQLGDERYTTRERAQAELQKLGFLAFEALAEAQNHEDIEIALRAQYLVRSMRIRWIADHDSPAVKIVLKGYEQLGVNDRVKKMTALSHLSLGDGTEALCRLARFERTEMLSKQAGLLVIEQSREEMQSDLAKRQRIIRIALGRSKRTAVQWLRVYATWLEEPTDSLESWQEVVDEERRILTQYPDQSSRRTVLALLRRQVEMLRQLDRHEEATLATRQLFESIDGSRAELREIVSWLSDQNNWSMIAEASKRFVERFESDALLLYRFAQANVELDQLKKAEETATRARKINANNPEEHVRTAYILQTRGLFRWSEKEYQYVIELAPLGSLASLRSHFMLSEMLHDIGRNQQAGEVLQDIVKIMEKDATARHRSQRPLPGVRSRMHFFFASHFASQSDHQKKKEHLEKAIEQDPTDADVLIAIYRFSKTDDPWRLRAQKLISEAVDEFRQMIHESPNEPHLHNQLAWLVSNTEGDFDEALRSSQKSLELLPNRAGFLDTLGRCYYAKGDLEKAIQFQSQAVRLEPFSGQIKSQLEFFTKEKAAADAGSLESSP